MEKGKSPGCDGFPVEFYQVFWNDVNNLFFLIVYTELIKKATYITKTRFYNPSTVTLFVLIPGLKVNYYKTETLWIGSQRGSSKHPFPGRKYPVVTR